MKVSDHVVDHITNYVYLIGIPSIPVIVSLIPIINGFNITLSTEYTGITNGSFIYLITILPVNTTVTYTVPYYIVNITVSITNYSNITGLSIRTMNMFGLSELLLIYDIPLSIVISTSTTDISTATASRMPTLPPGITNYVRIYSV